MKHRNTPSKDEVLRILTSASSALSHTEIEEKTNIKFDRVTLYRILTSYEQQGVIHKVIGLDGKARYALCKHSCHDNDHKHDNHLHFGCNDCGKMFCFDDKAIDVKMPKGFKALQFNYAVYGICPDCNV